jgi:hypothetical protein
MKWAAGGRVEKFGQDLSAQSAAVRELQSFEQRDGLTLLGALTAIMGEHDDIGINQSDGHYGEGQVRKHMWGGQL